LGLGDQTQRNTPTLVSSLSHVKVIQVSAGWDFSLALTSEGRIFSFGRNDKSQLGQGDLRDRNIPEEIKSIPTKIKLISTGWYHSMALDENGEVWVWGENRYGRLGLHHETDQKYPVKLSLPSRTVSVACGGIFSGALSKKGDLFLWGDSYEVNWEQETLNRKIHLKKYHFQKRSFIFAVDFVT